MYMLIVPYIFLWNSLHDATFLKILSEKIKWALEGHRHLEHTAFRINSIIRPSYQSSTITEELIIQDDNSLIKGL